MLKVAFIGLGKILLNFALLGLVEVVAEALTLAEHNQIDREQYRRFVAPLFSNVVEAYALKDARLAFEVGDELDFVASRATFQIRILPPMTRVPTTSATAVTTPTPITTDARIGDIGDFTVPATSCHLVQTQFTSADWAGCVIGQLDMSARFKNPSGGKWDYGFIARNQDGKGQYRLSVNSDHVWTFYRGAS